MAVGDSAFKGVNFDFHLLFVCDYCYNNLNMNKDSQGCIKNFKSNAAEVNFQGLGRKNYLNVMLHLSWSSWHNTFLCLSRQLTE